MTERLIQYFLFSTAAFSMMNASILKYSDFETIIYIEKSLIGYEEVLFMPPERHNETAMGKYRHSMIMNELMS